MAKKVVLIGAPAYMALYTSLMTIMLSFFILLSTLTEDQEAGFKSGYGDIRNAFGLKGGFGLNQYAEVSRELLSFIVPERFKDNDGFLGTQRNAVEGEGGGGNTDADLTDNQGRKHVRIRVPYNFEPHKSGLTLPLTKYLDMIGTGLALFDYRLSVRCFVNTEATPTANRLLAAKRAAVVMRYLNHSCQIPLTAMDSAGYNTVRHFVTSGPDDKRVVTEMTYIYLFKQKSK